MLFLNGRFIQVFPNNFLICLFLFLIFCQTALNQELTAVKSQVEDLQREKVWSKGTIFMLAISQGWLKGGNQQEKRPSKDLTFQVTINFYFKVRQFFNLKYQKCHHRWTHNHWLRKKTVLLQLIQFNWIVLVSSVKKCSQRLGLC